MGNELLRKGFELELRTLGTSRRIKGRGRYEFWSVEKEMIMNSFNPSSVLFVLRLREWVRKDFRMESILVVGQFTT